MSTCMLNVMYLIGVVNGRLGGRQDVIKDLDGIKGRVVLDKGKNNHGDK